MKLKRTAVLMILALAGMCALGCGGGGGSPTSANGFFLVFRVAVNNTAGQATINQAQLLFDGVTISIAVPSPAAATASLNVSGSGAGSGSHTMQVAIVDQTSSPNSYTVTMPSIIVADANGTVLKTIQLNTQTATLATGGSISYSFSL